MRLHIKKPSGCRTVFPSNWDYHVVRMLIGTVTAAFDVADESRNEKPVKHGSREKPAYLQATEGSLSL